MARKSFDEPWMPFAELAVGTASPVLGATLGASRILANNANSRKSKDNASGLYFVILAIGGLAFLRWLSPPSDLPPK